MELNFSISALCDKNVLNNLQGVLEHCLLRRIYLDLSERGCKIDMDKSPHLVRSTLRELRQLGRKPDHLPRSNVEDKEG
jgi:hypothetical protein